MKKRCLAMIMAFCVALSLVPATALATGGDGNEEGTTPAARTIYVDATSGNDTQPDVGTTADKAYKSIGVAVKAAESGDTIMLAAGCYSLYEVCGKNDTGGNKEYTRNKDLTFIGAGPEETKWGIGAEVPDPANFGTEYNGDYSFDGAGTVTFKDMTLQSAKKDYLGFIRANNTVVDNCTINGKTFYWGYTSATFKNTTFNCPSGDYAIWTYSSPTMTFDTCTFNSSGKVINVYTDYGAGKYDITVNFKDCTVNGNTPEGKKDKAVMNINDSNMGGYKYIINISGTNVVNGVTPDNLNQEYPDYQDKKSPKKQQDISCSRLFEFNTKYGAGNSGRTVVNFNGKTVWENGKMVDAEAYHTAGVKVSGVTYNNGVAGANDSLYAEGYKDNAFTTTHGFWAWDQDENKLARTVTKTCQYCGAKVTNTEYKDLELDVSRSKTAKELDSNRKSTVKLSLPSAEEKLVSDVVFVLDGSSSAETDVVKESLTLLKELQEAVKQSDAAVNVCVVKFKRQAFKSQWYDLSKNFDAIKEAMGKKYSEGTNIHAGLLAGKEALEDHANVSANRKYLILISDGSTYLYSKDGDWASDTPFTRSYYTRDNYEYNAGGFSDNAMYEPNNYPDVNVPRPKTTSDVAVWQNYLKDVKARNETVNSEGKTGDDYDYHCNYDLNFNQVKPSDDFKSQPCEKRTANNRDMAFYYADQTWQEMKAGGYHLFSIATKDGSAGAGNADDSRCFMNYLNEGVSLNFSDIKNDIFYAVGAGSVVEDKMGADFDFVPGSLKLTVGGTELQSKADDNNGNMTYFGDDAENLNEVNCRFKVLYDLDADSFVWTINENVSNFAPVQLSYQVKLVNANTMAGTYKVLTNEYAKLTPKNSAGQVGTELKFNDPEVSYTVSGGGHGGNGGGTVTIPDDVPTGLNGKDHYAYVVGYPDGMVYPQKNITRAEVATIFFRLLKDETREANMTKSNSYNDMKDGAWYTCAVSTLSKMGIIKGYEDGSFKPDASISRAEFAAIAARFDPDGDKTPATFSDVSSHWAKDEISIAANHGWIKGYEDGSFKPDQKITRAETMTLVNRVLKRLPETKDDLHKDMKTWPDNQNESAWFYLAVQEATNSHYQKLKKDGTHETWESMRETRDWAALEK